MMIYPITTSVNGKRKKIANKLELIKVYDKIFTSSYKEAILDTFGRNLFTHRGAIALGNGLIWFNREGKIIALNN